MSDDAEIKREVRNLYMRANIVARLYSRCSQRVKLMLFKSFCMCFMTFACGGSNLCLLCIVSSQPITVV